MAGDAGLRRRLTALPKAVGEGLFSSHFDSLWWVGLAAAIRLPFGFLSVFSTASFGHCRAKGLRPTMEDTVLAAALDSVYGTFFFGVFDGTRGLPVQFLLLN